MPCLMQIVLSWKKKKKKNILEHSSVKQEFIISFLFIVTGSGKI